MSKAQINRLVRLIREGEVSCADELYHLLERVIPSLNNSLKKSTQVLNSGGEDPHLQRTSVFLREETEVLHQVVHFFLGTPPQNSSYERRTFFLAQIDFWDGKVNQLREDFRSFEERSRTWDNWRSLKNKLEENGWKIRDQVIQDLKKNLRWRRLRRRGVLIEMREPDRELESLLKDWNLLLISVSKILVKDQRDLFIECYTKE